MPDHFGQLSREELEAAQHAVRMGDVDYYQYDDDGPLVMVGIVNALALTAAAALAVTLALFSLWVWVS